jgi:hypothetical protein
MCKQCDESEEMITVIVVQELVGGFPVVRKLDFESFAEMLEREARLYEKKGGPNIS